MYAPPRDNVTRPLLAKLLDVLVPAPCLACNRPVPEQRDSFGLCPACRGRLVLWPSSGCASCGRPTSDAVPDGYRCGACRRRPPPYDGLLSAWSYQPPIDSVLTGLKFRRLEYLGSHLGPALARRFRDRLAGCDVVVPVPLHWWRYLQRGYNQAAAIARPLARELGLPVRRALRRRRPTPAQSRLSRGERQRNVAGAFATRRPVHFAGRRDLLVDDVTTTGATLRTAAQCLLDAGAASVTALAAARTPEEPPRQKTSSP